MAKSETGRSAGAFSQRALPLWFRNQVQAMLRQSGLITRCGTCFSLFIYDNPSVSAGIWLEFYSRHTPMLRSLMRKSLLPIMWLFILLAGAEAQTDFSTIRGIDMSRDRSDPFEALD